MFPKLHFPYAQGKWAPFTPALFLNPAGGILSPNAGLKAHCSFRTVYP